ncbi:MAG: NAD(P)/FAD-dependent oxidoreductase [Desulfofustis sp.]|nr:NAD(P)/FAD-dependent oxidoreductase [Desulfofustis sp.]
MDCVVIGGGVAGMQAALSFRKAYSEKTVTLVDNESEVGYYRTLLPQFMNRTLPENKLFFWQDQDDPRFTIISGVRVESLERENRALVLSDGSQIPYRRLIIASGGRPVIPPVCGAAGIAGVFTVRSLTTARAARVWLPQHPEVVIVGGGLVGVKTAAYLASQDIPVTLIEKENHLLPQALSSQAAKLAEEHLLRNKVQLLLGSTIEDIQSSSGSISAIKASGQWVNCRTLFVAAGSVPEVTFLADSGLLREGNLEVNRALQTTDANIFAAGDAVTIVERDNFTPWTWPQAAVQGQLAAHNLYLPAPFSLSCLSRVNAMNLHGLSLVVLGIPVEGAERCVYTNPAAGVYRELYQVDGRIVGGALVGDITNAGKLHWMMNIGDRIDTDFTELLEPRLETFAKMSPSCAKLNQRAVFLPS